MITKSDLVKAVSKKCALPFSTTERVTDVLFMEIAEAILKGEDVALARLGRFHVMERKSRRGRNPRTGEEIIIPDRRAVIFKLAAPLSRSLNA